MFPIGELVRTTFLFANVLLGFPFIALLVMNFGGYFFVIPSALSSNLGELLVPFAVLTIALARLTWTSDHNFVISLIPCLSTHLSYYFLAAKLQSCS